MRVERLARKSFGFVVAALLACAIYFQASGVVELAASHLLADDTPSAPSKARRTKHTKTVAQHAAKSGDPILERNAFDSVTGPLNREPIQVELPGSKAPTLDLSDPLTAPECDDVTLDIVSESPDAAWSVAQLRGPGDTAASMRRVGDTVGKLQVAYIGYNLVKGSPAAWLVGNDKLCQALLFSEKAQKAKEASAPAPAPAPRAATPAVNARASAAPALPPEIASKISKVSDTEFNVDRSVIDNVLENQAQLMRSARLVPEQKDGKTVGINLYGIRPDTLLGTLGLQNGDRLEQINGFDIANPEKALEAYARLRTASQLTVQITRAGKPTTIAVHIK